MLFESPPAVMNAVSVLGSWTPTIVLLVMLKKLRPGSSVADFYRNAFKARPSVPLFAAIAVMAFGALAAAALVASLVEGTRPLAPFVMPSSIVGALALTAMQGPSGEESGWRGYLRPELEGRFGFLKGNLILGLVWAFWHAPLWFLASGFSGARLVLFIAANVVVLSSLTLIMAALMRRCDNILVAFWVHFFFNLSLRVIEGGVVFFAALSAVYVALAIAVLAVMRKDWAPGA
jgi:membrane protease YdiL (CAAX protease family)